MATVTITIQDDEENGGVSVHAASVPPPSMDDTEATGAQLVGAFAMKAIDAVLNHDFEEEDGE